MRFQHSCIPQHCYQCGFVIRFLGLSDLKRRLMTLTLSWRDSDKIFNVLGLWTSLNSTIHSRDPSCEVAGSILVDWHLPRLANNKRTAWRSGTFTNVLNASHVLQVTLSDTSARLVSSWRHLFHGLRFAKFPTPITLISQSLLSLWTVYQQTWFDLGKSLLVWNAPHAQR